MIVSIDPGKSGAVAFFEPPFCPDGLDVGLDICVHDTPVSGGEYQLEAMATLLDEHNPGVPPRRVFVETTHAHAGQNINATASQFYGIGLWVGMAAGFGWPVQLLTAHSSEGWAKVLGIPFRAGKGYHRDLAKQLFPQLEDKLRRAKDDGRADALLIGEAGRRMHGA